MPNAAYGMQEPEKYLPERFMEGTPEAAAKPAHGYLPFGDGTRACIGLRFARMEVRLKNTLAKFPNVRIAFTANAWPIWPTRNNSHGNAHEVKHTLPRAGISNPAAH